MENMTKYELIKDLPTFKKGEIFVLLGSGLHRYSDGLMAYPRAVIDKYPNILKEWFREVENEPKTWKPKVGDVYWHILAYSTDVGTTTWAGNSFDLAINETGNVFRTKDEAKKAVEWLKARKVLYDDTKGFKPDWKDAQEYKWSVAWDWEGVDGVHEIGLFADFDASETYSPGPYFATEEDAEASIKAHEREWRIYLLGVEE